MKPALLLVDLQNDYLAAPDLQPPSGILTHQAAALLENCRRCSVPVIHAWTTVRRENDQRLPHWKYANRWICLEGTPGHQPPEPLRPKRGEILVHKAGFNAFANPKLDGALRKLGCDTVILAGVHLHTCVRTAAMECLERGYQVRIASDAVASNDPVHAAAVRRWLEERCVAFEPVAEILNRRPRTILVHRSPRVTAQVLFEIPIAGPSEIALATAAAQEAWAAWRRVSPAERLRFLKEVGRRLESAAPDLARQMAIEIGKPVSQGLEEVRRAAQNIGDVARRAADGARTTLSPACQSRKRSRGKGTPRTRTAARGSARNRPLGVVAIISPWNNPVAIPLGKIAPALAYGNTVVWKPAPAANRIAQALWQLLRKAGVPPGVVNLLAGDHSTAQQLAADAKVNAVTLTGSLAAGFAVQEICARRVVPLQAELSGNNAAIVWNDADLTQAAAQIAWGAFAFAGQRCTANRRVIVPTALSERFLQQLSLAGERLAWGDPLEESTEIGPVIDTAKRDELTALIATAEADGYGHRLVRLHEPRTPEPWVEAGAYAQPAIIACGDPNHALVQEETMSPLLVMQPADDFEHALELCNGVRHGLAAALFSNSRKLQRRFLEEARAGMLKLNAPTAGVDVTLPFGGWKASGLGPPEHGEGDALFYTRLQAVYGAQDFV